MRQLRWLIKVPAFFAMWASLATLMALTGLIFGARPPWPAVIAQSGLIVFGAAIGGQWFTGPRQLPAPQQRVGAAEGNAPDRIGLRGRRPRKR